MAIEDARKKVKDAEETLAEDLEDSPEIVAPFDGFIIMVNVAGGDEVLKCDAGDAAVRVQRHQGTAQVLSQASGSGDGVAGDGQVQVAGIAAQDGIAQEAAHGVGFQGVVYERDKST